MAGNKGVSVQVRNVFGEDVIWLSIKIFYLASREDCSIYYASVSNSSEQMGVLNKLNMLRRSFETALDLIDAIALEYYFINNTIDVKTKLAEDIPICLALTYKMRLNIFWTRRLFITIRWTNTKYYASI